MYLWRRPSGFLFQIRIPSDLAPILGKTPLRVKLGQLSTREAERRARLLAGAAEKGFMAARKRAPGKNPAVDAEVENLLAEVDAAITSLSDTSDLDEAERALAIVSERLTTADRDDEIADLLAAVRDRLDAPPAAPSPPPAPLVSDAAGMLLSEAAKPVLDARRAALTADGDGDATYADHIERAVAAFVEIAGDRPLRDYLPVDLQEYANVLARVPKNRSKLREFNGLTLRKAADRNDRMKIPKPRLTSRAIGEYVGAVKSTWRRVTAGVPGVRDIGVVGITAPRSAAKSTVRQGLPVESINTWIAAAATRKGSSHWLPPVAVLTGMRLAELVYLQGGDLCEESGHLVLDLRRPIILNGRSVERPLKTETSERLVAVHPALHEIGFVDYLRSRPDGEWAFPDLHRNAKDPPDAASKRMRHWMVSLGIHAPQSEVFHSLRHNAKAWLRPIVGERTADLQCGHKPGSDGHVGGRYGFRLLLPAELAQIEAAPLPDGLDLTPFVGLDHAAFADLRPPRPVLKRKPIRKGSAAGS
ncbi:DUF6538 domain-containing protein [Xanthobacter agilis]|uniref:DUF6538 domain-containing protein n=1 Tax=Xanthobacter agilis TaxID=47492 RepID=UPI00372CDB23